MLRRSLFTKALFGLGKRKASPLDPALQGRARAERLFGFRYRVEMFAPEARRQYRHYVFPVLQGDRLIGRIDAKRGR